MIHDALRRVSRSVSATASASICSGAAWSSGGSCRVPVSDSSFLIFFAFPFAGEITLHVCISATKCVTSAQKCSSQNRPSKHMRAVPQVLPLLKHGLIVCVTQIYIYNNSNTPTAQQILLQFLDRIPSREDEVYVIESLTLYIKITIIYWQKNVHTTQQHMFLGIFFWAKYQFKQPL